LGNQALPVIYDTGSFEIIVLSTLCEACRSTGLAMYDNKMSSSFAPSGGVSSEHLFGSGSVVSEQGFEHVHIGQSSQFSAPHMSFWQVVRHQIPVWNEHAHFSGIVGLGHTSTVPEGYASHGEQGRTMLAAMGVNSFAFCLERSGAQAPGWLTMGPTVEAWAQGAGPFQSLPVVGRTHWGVKMTSFHVNGLGIENPCAYSCGAIVDSGTSLIAAPTSARHIVEKIESMVKTDCSNLQQLPVLEIRLGDVLVELPPKAYVMQVQTTVQANSTVYGRLVRRTEVQNECVAAFMMIDKQSDYGPVWILGMSFLRYYYTVFDRASKTIHIAKASPDCQVPLSNNVGYVNRSGFVVNGSMSSPTGLVANASSASGSTFAAAQGGRAFAAADYEATKVDLNEARAPEWAVSDDVKDIRL
jgi:hypothetical protein